VWISGPKLPLQQKRVDKGCLIWFTAAGCSAMQLVENGEEMHQSRHNPFKTRKLPAAAFNPQSRSAAILATCSRLDRSRICSIPKPASSDRIEWATWRELTARAVPGAARLKADRLKPLG
jgi:hypothetical protein